MDLFSPQPSLLIKWALNRPNAPSAEVARDPGVLVLARAVGVLGLYCSHWNINWKEEPPFDSIPDLTDARIGEMHAHTRAALRHRADALDNQIEDTTRITRLLTDRANFSTLLAHPNSAPAGVRAALNAAAAEDILLQEGENTDVAGINWGPVGAWLSNQILLSMMDPEWGEDSEPESDPELDCDSCRLDAFTPWELVWKYYSVAELAAHIASYHCPLAQAKRYLESLRHSGSKIGYACPGWDYTKHSPRKCDASYATHEALADHMLRAHLDDIGAELPARYLVVFAEGAAAKAAVASALGDKDPHYAAMAHWLPKMLEWAASEEQHNDSAQSRRFAEFMERHPPSETLWNPQDSETIVI